MKHALHTSKALVTWCLVGLLGLMAGCAGAPGRLAEPLLADELFTAVERRPTAAEVFALDAPMREYLQREVLPRVRSHGPVQALVGALYEKDRLVLEYDSSSTRNAREAFASRAGNCLSLVIMTAAFARELGLEVQFRNVLAEEAWDRNNDLYFFIGHVNLSIGPRMSTAWYAGSGGWTVIDFLPSRDLATQRTQPISESRIVSMFMNNRAAEAVAGGRLDEAYAWARAAVLEDAQFVSAYNTLGVVYQRRGAHALAERVFRAALQVEPTNAHVMGNLVLALEHQGRAAEAKTVAAELRRLQPHPPFALFREGQQALREGDFRRAATLFEREIDRAPEYHEFHFYLAVALLQMGETRSARRHLEKALEASTTREHSALYSAKLQKLKAARAQPASGS